MIFVYEPDPRLFNTFSATIAVPGATPITPLSLTSAPIVPDT